MCGITGIYGLEDKNIIRKMTDIISHRGPDDRGYYNNENVSLGHRRLSIIDLSEKGKQPMTNEDGDIVIVYNGEIYNYKELREKLKNHKFKSNTDTEVIIHLYEEYGEDCLGYLRGMFAFAIYDKKKNRIFLARDRLGIKPLYYTKVGDTLVFASEIKSILQFGVEREVDRVSLSNYLALRFVNGPRTMFKNIRKLQPGHYIIYENGKGFIKKYWSLEYKSDNKSEDYYINNLLNLMDESVKLRLMSDVPLGAYISGGIDSGTVAYFMSKHIKNLKTFSVGFDNKEDELKYAKIISDKFKTDHHEIIVKPDTSKLLPEIVWHFDEPLADPTAIPTYLLSKKAKENVTVVLTGEGGDETLAGYEQYKIIKLGKALKYFPFKGLLPGIAKRFSGGTLNKFFKYAESLGEKGIDRFEYFLNNLDDNTESYMSLVGIFDAKEREEILRKNEEINIDFSPLYPKKDWLSGLLEFETKIALPDNLLMKVDKMTMAHAVEARVPFLDHKFVEFSAKIPSNLKLKGFNEKYILRKAMQNKLPREIVNRKKQRFFVPIDNWISKDMKEMTLNLLSEGAIQKEGLLNYSYINNVFNNYKKSKLYYARQLWNLLNFELWHRIYIDRGFLYNPNLKKII